MMKDELVFFRSENWVWLAAFVSGQILSETKKL